MAKKAKVIPLRPTTPRNIHGAYILKVALRDVKPPIWRRLRVATDLTLRDLHHVLQIALGWTDSHLHEFEIGGKRYGMPDPQEDIGPSPLDEQNYRLIELFQKGSRAEYLYDFGDDWRHEVVVEDAVSSESDAPKAQCLAGARACPLEDCGGPYGYADLLEVLANPSNERYAELREWVGPDFAPEDFDLAFVNRELRGAGSVSWRRKREQFYGS
jgi:hypothetical protein